MILQRLPSLPLRPYIQTMWASDGVSDRQFVAMGRERMLPTGNMHLVFRLTDCPIRIFESVDDRVGQDFGFAVIAGIRSTYYVKDVESQTMETVGAILQPGVSSLLFDVAADEFAERHVSLEDVWGCRSAMLREQLQHVSSLSGRLDLLESFLSKQLAKRCDVHPAVTHFLQRISHSRSIGSIVKETGYSHKHFIQIFRKYVGASPGLYSRLLRFQHSLKLLNSTSLASVEIAQEIAYSDQAHLTREFREFAGISPGEYRKLQSNSHHVPISSGTRGR